MPDLEAKMPDLKGPVIDPPEEAKLVSVATEVPKAAVSLRGESVDHVDDEAYLHIFAAVVDVGATHSAAGVKATKV